MDYCKEKKVAFHTLGCKVNQYESEVLAQIFEKEGYRVVDFNEKADVYVINTCTVTGISARKSRQMIRRARKSNRDAVVAAVGCYPQTAPGEVSGMDGVDIVVGTQSRESLPAYVEEFKETGGRMVKVSDITGRKEYEEFGISTFRDRTRAYVKIQDGCSRFCSYCIIPYARGPVRSRKPESIKNEVEKLSAEGFREIVLTGIHIASYGRDLNGYGLMDIIGMIHGMDGIERIRMSSVEPGLITEEFIDMAVSLSKLCPHFHMSLQSGCDETLKRMNRTYTTQEYENIVNMLLGRIPDVAVTTDVMTGFPGETDEEFAQTYKYLEGLPLAGMHVFKYSRRKGTPAASFGGQVDPQTKEERSRKLIEMSKTKQLEYYKRFEGRRMQVLFERTTGEIQGYLEGRTGNYIRVVARGGEGTIGEIRDVVLDDAGQEWVFGHIV